MAQVFKNPLQQTNALVKQKSAAFRLKPNYKTPKVEFEQPTFIEPERAQRIADETKHDVPFWTGRKGEFLKTARPIDYKAREKAKKDRELYLNKLKKQDAEKLQQQKIAKAESGFLKGEQDSRTTKNQIDSLIDSFLGQNNGN